VTTHHNSRNHYRRLTRFVDAATGRLDSAIVAVSEEVAKSLSEAERRKCTTLVHGVDVEAVRAEAGDRNSARVRLKIPRETPTVGTIANFTAQKDYDNLLMAFERVRRVVPDARLVAVGGGPLFDETVDRASRLGLDSSTSFLGQRSDALSLLPGFDVFVLASAWEGLPVSLMEATAVGVPIVATSVGGVQEAFTETDCAVLVPPRDSKALAAAVIELVENRDLQRQMSESALAYSAKFSAKRASYELMAIYETTAGHRDH
jgi:glycosyltransferase involved in cell wall biosynthesis